MLPRPSNAIFVFSLSCRDIACLVDLFVGGSNPNTNPSFQVIHQSCPSCDRRSSNTIHKKGFLSSSYDQNTIIRLLTICVTIRILHLLSVVLTLLLVVTMSDAAASSSSSKSKQRWFPLESNPQLMNDYVAKLGLDTSQYQFCDVYSTEEWALAMVPQPVAAVLLLYPLTDKQEAASAATDQFADASEVSNMIWFTKQRIGNACGTIGILHALQNAPPVVQALYQPNSWLEKFAADTPCPMDPVKKAERLEQDAQIATLHDQATASETNATERGNIDDDLVTHFIALVHVNGQLYELDGRKVAPVVHGPTTPETLLKDAVQVIQNTFMQRDPSEVRFTILALAPKDAAQDE